LSLSAAIFLQSSSCWIYTQPIPKEPTEQYCEKKPEEFGSTENKLEYLIKSYGLNTESQITKNDIEYVLYTTKPARDIIDKEQFDIAKKKFDIKQFKGFVMNNFIEGIDYYSKNFPTPIKKVHIVITDFGKARDKNSTYTWMNTSIIHTDVRRWHKYWIYDNSLMAKVIAAHEFTHIQNYSLDRNETKVGKEYAAITVECLAYINFAGKEKFKKAYPERAAKVEAAENAKKLSTGLTILLAALILLYLLDAGGWQVVVRAIQGLLEANGIR